LNVLQGRHVLDKFGRRKRAIGDRRLGGVAKRESEARGDHYFEK
jgi:hypothetical protein